MFNVQTINCMQSQSRNEINRMICFNWKEAIWSLTKEKNQGDKKEKLTESLQSHYTSVDGKNSKKVEL